MKKMKYRRYRKDNANPGFSMKYKTTQNLKKEKNPEKKNGKRKGRSILQLDE